MQIELSQQALQIIGNALVQRPYGEVFAVIQDIEQQVRTYNEALAAKQEPSHEHS